MTADVSFFPFLVEGVGNGQSVGIDFEHAVEGWTFFIDLLNPRQIFLRDRARGKFSGSHSRLQVGDGDFVQLEWFDLGLWGRAGDVAGGRQRR
jgi:hypothetical protein